MQKLIFRCKNCGWEDSVSSQWVDLSPRYCGNKKCEYSGRVKLKPNSFMKTPSMLEIITPKVEKPAVPEHKAETPPAEKVASDFEEKSEQKKSRRKSRRGQ